MVNKVEHDEVKNEFYIDTDRGKAVLQYKKKNNQLNFAHTYVPRELRGQGIANEIVKAGFEYAQNNNFQVIPSCSYVAKLAKKNEEWQKLCNHSQ